MHSSHQHLDVAKGIAETAIKEGIGHIPLQPLIVTGLRAIGLVTGTGPVMELAAIGAKLGTQALTSLGSKALEYSFDHWLKHEGEGALGGDIGPALSSACASAVGSVASAWEQSQAYRRLLGSPKDEDRREARRTVDALASLRDDAPAFLADTDRLAEAVKENAWAPVPNRPGDTAEARRLMSDALKNYFLDYNESFVEFVNARLPDEWIVQFSEVLKSDTPEGLRAWRACQQIWQASLEKSLAQANQNAAETREIAEWLKAWAERIHTMSPEQRDPTGQKGLDTVLAPIRQQLDEIKRTTEQTLRNTEDIKVGVVAANLGIRDIRTGIGELLDRPPVEVGPDGTVIVVTNEQAYKVGGLINPYLGLRSFTYDDRTIYAGREGSVQAALQALTTPGSRGTLLFVTGASGSGKSSFAQAGLLPALEAHYQARSIGLARGVFRPGRQPLAALADALMQLGMPASTLVADSGTAIGSAEAFASLVSQHTPPQRVNAIVVDQFEEVFSQSEEGPRRALVGLLSSLPPFERILTHVIVTLRSDYLPELFEIGSLYEAAKGGIDLRAMTVDELKEAIQKPLQVSRPAGDKRWQPALVDQLAAEAAADASYLPLLQVTLEEIWASGSLTLDRYKGLAHAIKERAEVVYAYTSAAAASQAQAVYAYADHAGARRQPRTPAEQAAITRIFLDLVSVSLDGDAHRDVRRSRSKPELVGNDPLRAGLVEELCQARLLSTSVQTRPGTGDDQVEVVDIIHETLIRNWDRLKEAITEKRSVLQQRVLFEQGMREWLAHDRSDDYLLLGVRLAEARSLDKQQDIALRGQDARELLDRSVTRQEVAQRQELEEQKRRAEEAARQARRLRALLGLAGLFLVVAMAAAVYASIQRGTAQQEARDLKAAQAVTQQHLRQAKAQALAGDAVAQLDRNPELGLLLAMEAVSTTRRANEPVVPQAENALHLGIVKSLLRRILAGDTSQMYSAVYSPDGKQILTASQDGTAKIWDAETGQVRQTLSSHDYPVRGAAWSPDGKRVVTGSDDKTATIWDAPTGQVLRTLRGHTDWVFRVAFSPDGRLVATASADKTAKIWDAATGKELRTLVGHTGDVYGANWSPDGQRIVTASADGTATVWEVATGKQVRSLKGHSGEVIAAAYSPDGSLIATGGDDSTARIWDAATGVERLTLKGHSGGVMSVGWSLDGRTLVTASADATARVWNTATGQTLLVLRGHPEQLNSAAYGPDGHSIVTASNDHTARIWDTATGEERPTLRGHTSAVYKAAYSPDGRYIATGSRDNTAKIWDAATGKELRTLQGYVGEPVESVAWSPDGHNIVTASHDGMSRIWDVATGQLQRTLSGDTTGVYTALYSPDGRLILTTSADERATIWDATTGQEVRTLVNGTGPLITAAWSPDGRLIVTASMDKTAKIWDATTGQALKTLSGHTNWVNGAAFSPDGRNVATVSYDGTGKIWDVATGHEIHALQGHTDIVYTVAYSPDGRSIVTGSADGTVRVWDAATGEPRLTLTGYNAGVVFSVISASYSPDGRYIVTGCSDGAARQYLADVGDLLKLAQSRVSRGLTPEERALYVDDKSPASTPTAATPMP